MEANEERQKDEESNDQTKYQKRKEKATTK